MQFIIILTLLAISAYTFGFGVTLWKEKQKIGAMAVFFLIIVIVVLPFFSVF